MTSIYYNTHIACVSPIKGNQTMKFGQLTENWREFFSSKNHAENEVEKLVSDHFLFFYKALH